MIKTDQRITRVNARRYTFTAMAALLLGGLFAFPAAAQHDRGNNHGNGDNNNQRNSTYRDGGNRQNTVRQESVRVPQERRNDVAFQRPSREPSFNRQQSPVYNNPDYNRGRTYNAPDNNRNNNPGFDRGRNTNPIPDMNRNRNISPVVPDRNMNRGNNNNPGFNRDRNINTVPDMNRNRNNNVIPNHDMNRGNNNTWYNRDNHDNNRGGYENRNMGRGDNMERRNLYTRERPGNFPEYRYDRRPVYNAYEPAWRYNCLPARNSFFFGLPSTYLSLNFGGFGYRYWDGVFYRPYNNMFTVCAPPIGIYLNTLPYGYRRIYAGGYPYYYYNGTFYDQRDNGYYVVSPPVGAVVESLPDGYQSVDLDGETLYSVDGALYRPVEQENGEIWYEVVKAN